MPFHNTDSRTNYRTQTCIKTPEDGLPTLEVGNHTCHSMASHLTQETSPKQVPQGSVLSPTHFNIYMHDTRPTPANINIM